ncbi:zinc-binding alcohol dehydrogenase family protein [Enterococcus sp. DIV0660C]|uniref:zinc-binding alcohol dehydrogenase family protein n=1 Tax=Enterococcus sp. DIV0660C TaxID=2230880 RepID=UPI001F5C846E|nr:zinc-binding alcohol dehydrogenase family protein [Enterococcus sp. DIV0660C]
MKKQMKKIGFYQGLPIEEKASFIEITDAVPVATGHDLLVEVDAISVNPVDTKFRQNAAKKDQLTVLGFDAVGRIVAVGERVEKFQIGERVFYAGSSKRPGSNQEFQLVDERIVAKAPASLSDEEVAALPLTSLTAFELLFEKFQLTSQAKANIGKKLLVINGGGGVGSILTQLAKWSGLEIFATASVKNFEWLHNNGVDHPLDYHEDLKKQLISLGTDRVDYVAVLYDVVPYFQQLLEIVQPGGRVGTIVGINQPLPIGEWKNHSISFDWEYMFAKTDFDYKIETQGAILAKITTLVEQKEVHSHLGKVYQGISVTHLKQATKDVEEGHVQGKVVLTGGFVD